MAILVGEKLRGALGSIVASVGWSGDRGALVHAQMRAALALAPKQDNGDSNLTGLWLWSYARRDKSQSRQRSLNGWYQLFRHTRFHQVSHCLFRQTRIEKVGILVDSQENKLC